MSARADSRPASAVLLSARDPLAAGDGCVGLRLAVEMVGQAVDVTVVLLEAAVVVARTDHSVADELDAAVAAGIEILADEEALARRGVERLSAGVKRATMGEIIDRLFAADRQVWL